MAMSLKCKNTHWKWNNIQPRHFVSTAEHVKYPANKAISHYEYFIDNVESAIANVEVEFQGASRAMLQKLFSPLNTSFLLRKIYLVT